MSKSDPQYPNDEIHLFSLIDVLGNTWDRFLMFFYNIFKFILKFWLVFLLLVLVGGVAGYFLDKSDKDRFESEVLVRINFQGANYVENAIEVLQKKASEKDSLYLKSIGLWDEGPLLKKIEIEPENDLANIVETYPDQNRTLETIIKNVEVNDENTTSSLFFKDFKYFKINIVATDNADATTLSNLWKYLNNNDIFKSLSAQNRVNLTEEINQNKIIINQLDTLIRTYSTASGNGNLTTQIIIDRDLTGSLELKKETQEDISDLQEELILSNELVMVMNKPELLKKRKSFLKKYIILIPVLLIGFFVSIVSLLKFYRSMEVRMSNRSMQEL